MTINLLGTSHISKQSVDEIKQEIENYTPDIVAVELDQQRAIALLSEQKNKVSITQILQIGVKGYLFVKIGGYVQQKLGKMVGIAPGSDMKQAIILAKKNNLQVALIDQPINITLKKFSKNLTFKEKFRFLADILKGLILPKRFLKEHKLLKFDLTKVPPNELIEKLIDNLRQRYPSVYKTLIEDRNKYMVKRLIHLKRKYPDKSILAIIGAGHKKGMKELLLKIDIVGTNKPQEEKKLIKNNKTSLNEQS